MRQGGIGRYVAVSAVVTACGSGVARAAFSVSSIAGFAGFAPVNTVGTGPSVGYSADKNTLTLTDGGPSERTSGFTAVPQAISSFTASFTYTVPGGNGNTTGNADGITLAFENDARGAGALGGVGSDLGYGGTAGTAGISPSGAFVLKLYQSQGVGLAANGVAPVTVPDDTSGYLHVSGGSPIRVTLSYAGRGLTATVFDTGSRRSYTTAYPNFDLPGLVGGPTAYVGITGSTGGVTATQAVSGFTFTPTPNASAFRPVDVTGFDQRLVVPAAAAAGSSAQRSAAAAAALTGTLDNGSAKTSSTFYEQGFNLNNTSVGLPAGGGVVTGGVDASHEFRLLPYAQNESVLLDASHFTAGLTPTAPAAYAALSILAASSNGNSLVNVTVAYANGTSQRFADVVIPDWYGAGAMAVSANGRYTPSTDVFESQNSGKPGLFQIDLPLSDTADAVTYVGFQFDLFTPGSSGTHAAVFALSGSAVPEPAATGLAMAAAAPLVRRRRR